MVQTTTANTDKCPECKGEEWIEKGGAWQRCSCVERRIKMAKARELIKESGLRGDLLKKSFENYVPKNKEQKRALEKVRQGGSFFLIGPWGTGKTHLLAASVNDALARNVGALFFSVPWLLQMIREDLLSNRPIGIMQRVCEVEYLALDDLGKEKPSETVQEKLFMIFDRREVEGLRTSVTSNYVPETLVSEKLDGAIIDRIMGMTELILIEGPSHRRRDDRRG